MYDCKQATQIMSQALDRDITLRERFTLKMHLLFCGGCRRFEDQMAFIRRACRAFGKSIQEEDGKDPH